MPFAGGNLGARRGPSEPQVVDRTTCLAMASSRTSWVFGVMAGFEPGSCDAFSAAKAAGSGGARSWSLGIEGIDRLDFFRPVALLSLPRALSDYFADGIN